MAMAMATVLVVLALAPFSSATSRLDADAGPRLSHVGPMMSKPDQLPRAFDQGSSSMSQRSHQLSNVGTDSTSQLSNVGKDSTSRPHSFATSAINMNSWFEHDGVMPQGAKENSLRRDAALQHLPVVHDQHTSQSQLSSKQNLDGPMNQISADKSRSQGISLEAAAHAIQAEKQNANGLPQSQMRSSSSSSSSADHQTTANELQSQTFHLPAVSAQQGIKEQGLLQGSENLNQKTGWIPENNHKPEAQNLNQISKSGSQNLIQNDQASAHANENHYSSGTFMDTSGSVMSKPSMETP